MSGADVSEAVRQSVREAAGDRCGYCLQSTALGDGAARKSKHLFPRARGGGNEESNLWLSCSLCNRYKGTQIGAADPLSGDVVPLYNPRTDNWHEHFSWSADGAKVVGLMPVGRAAVVALKLNNEVAVEVRRNWILAGWHPPNA